MQDSQKAAMLRIVGNAALDLADVLDGDDSGASRLPAPHAEAHDPGTNLPQYAQKRANYLMAFVEAGGQLSLPQVTAAAKKAGVGNPGSATSHGYVTKAAPGTRAITEKGLKWLKENGYAVA
jgi:hypothetical protein